MSLPRPEELLPHRDRFLLLDRLLRLDADGAEAIGHFDPEDVHGHFPGNPIVPGVLLLEGLAQTLACLDLLRRGPEAGTPMLVGFDRVRFRAPVIPPAQVHYRVTVKEERFGMLQASGEVRHEERRVCTALILGTVAAARP
ncbi:MAG: hypothetical protein JRI25_25410 [Deltaproteobacteria bacterium]|nr:hypothetical protein [Deltaproteobacteria bacterium]MBW2257918.1 hypothetical protein [Deltaproteobacteria bacterium]